MQNPHKTYRKRARKLYRILIVICTLALIMAIGAFYFHNSPKEGAMTAEQPRENIHPDTGFINAPGMQETIIHCTGCHSAQLVTQSHMTREGWLATIRWMQETQNLWDLGENETIILDYLATHYAPKEKGRRENIRITEWYVLED